MRQPAELRLEERELLEEGESEEDSERTHLPQDSLPVQINECC